MARPVLLVKVGLGGVVFAARWGQNGSVPSWTTAGTPDLERSATVRDAPALEPAESPGDFLKRRFEYELSGQFGRSWDELHPAHKKVVTRDRYERCRAEQFERAGVSAELHGFEVLEIFDEPTDVVGVSEMSKAVSVLLTIADGGKTQSSLYTFHVVQIRDRWAWILSASAYSAYEAGSFPGGEAAQDPR